MPRSLLHPRHWLTWLSLGLLYITTKLPWHYQMWVGKQIGVLLFHTLKQRRDIACVNLSIAFPELSPQERKILNKHHFISLGQGVVDAALSWWASDAQIARLSHIEGLETFKQYYHDIDKNIIVLGAHFSSLEIGGRIIAAELPIHVVYRPHQNPVLEYISEKHRTERYGKAIPKKNMRDMIKSIKSGQPVWYATDQNFRGKGSELMPFFGVEAPTNINTPKLAKLTNAVIFPAISVRVYDKKEGNHGYLLKIYPPVEHIPSGDDIADTKYLTAILEEQIRNFPEQYLWTHKRYKSSEQQADFYKNKLNSMQQKC